MSTIKLTLFGPPRLERDGKPLKVRRRKALALLAYLAATDQPHSRDTLATLLWPEVSQRRARGNLRRALSDLKQDLGEGVLLLESDNVGLAGADTLSLDLTRFRAYLAACEEHAHPRLEACSVCLSSLAEAADLYQADFLAGFTLRDTVAFDDWQYFEAETLRREYATVLQRLVEGLSARGDFEGAIPFARRRLALDPLHEPAQQSLMQLYYQTGQASAALRQYEVYVELLDQELGVRPDDQTTNLYESIKADRAHGRATTMTIAAATEEVEATFADRTPFSRQALPFQPTSFVGREKELGELSQLLLKERDCRLLTLVGPGGMGKTRLAVEVGARVSTEFRDGAHFVSLAPVGEAALIVPAVAEALGLTFQGDADPREQLLHHLGSRNYLLVIDNFEHLRSTPDMSEGGENRGEDLLIEMLRIASDLKLLVTSRERLNLQEEWGYDVQGMSFPEERTAAEVAAQELDEFPAIQLFLQRARMAKPDVSFSAEEIEAVIHICRLVSGMPLGIELAAPWVRVMSPLAIADELAGNLDLLSTAFHNVPERHRSMRAILEQTWGRLLAKEQSVLSKLSVFRGGCTREAAEAVAGATLPLLASLVDKALLRRIDGERFELHELIRQFAQEQLQQSPRMLADTERRHGRYFAAFLEDRVDGLKGGPQLETLRQTTADIDNVRAAWQHGIKTRDCEALDRASECLYLYSELSGALAAGERAFRQAADALRGEELENLDGCASVEAFLLMGQGTLRAHRGDLQRGQALLEHGLALLDTEDHERSSVKKRAFGLLWLGWVLFLQARNTEAQEAIQRSLELHGELGDRWGVAKNLYIMGNSLTGSGRLSEAEPPLRQSLAISHEIGDRRSRLLVDWNLAILDFWFGDYAQTEAFLGDAAMLGREFNDQIGLALALKERGKLEVARGEYEQAIQTFHESIAITDEIGSQWESAATLDDLALALCLSGDYAGAESAVRQCLLASQARQHHYFVARCYGDLGLIAFKRREFQQAEKNLLDALGIWQDLGHEPYLAWVRCQLGHLRQATGPERKHEAAEDYGRALQLSVKHGLAPIAMEVFGAVGAQLAEDRDLARAFTLLALASHHPASTYATREKARQVVADLGIDLSLDAAMANGKAPDWVATATELTERMAHWDSGPSER